MRILFTYLFIFGFLIINSQTPKTFKFKKEDPAESAALVDSAFYDLRENALYSKTSGYQNRFKTLKHCTLSYRYKWRSGTIIVKKNKLSKEVEKIVDSKSRKIVLKFSDIVLHADSLNSNERKCPDFTITFYGRRSFWLAIGPWSRIPWPIPSFRTIRTTVAWPE